MRVVFMGTPEFAVVSLRALARVHDVAAVYTRPDSVSGRGGAIRPSAVKETAIELGLDVRTPLTLRDETEHAALGELSPDIGVVAAYGLILPPEILEIPSHGFVNVHASLLPRWRGAAPIQRAILSADEITGVSIMRMEEGLDTGPFCDLVTTSVDEKSAEALSQELAELGAEALLRSLERIDTGTCDWKPQDAALATYADKLSKADVRLSPTRPAAELVRRIHASSRQAPARLMIGTDRVLTVVDAKRTEAETPMAIARRQGQTLVLGTSAGSIELLRIKPEGRKEMDTASWLRGTNIPDETIWDSA